jgi:hypothetical protein
MVFPSSEKCNCTRAVTQFTKTLYRTPPRSIVVCTGHEQKVNHKKYRGISLKGLSYNCCHMHYRLSVVASWQRFPLIRCGPHRTQQELGGIHRQQSDLICLLLFFRSKESMLKMKCSSHMLVSFCMYTYNIYFSPFVVYKTVNNTFIK